AWKRFRASFFFADDIAMRVANQVAERLSLGERVRSGSGFFGDFAPERDRTAAARTGPPQYNWRSDKDRRVSSHHDTDDDGQSKITQHGPAEEEQTTNRYQSATTGQKRAAQRLIDTIVHDLLD